MSLNTLKKNEQIITAFAQIEEGSGWYNRVVWVVVKDSKTHEINMICLQPEDLTKEMEAIYDFSSLAHNKMTNVVKNLVKSMRKNAE